MVARRSFLSKIRLLGCRYKRETARVQLYRQTGTGKIVTIPRSKFLSPVFVLHELRKLGAPEEEIARFINEEAARWED